MKYDLITPCAQCPFRSDVRPFIKAERAREILTGNAPFACHKTCDYDGGEEGEITEDTQHCAGVLIILEKENAPHQMMRICERIGFYDRRKLRMDAPVYDSIHVCIAAHRKVGARPRVGMRK